MGRATLEAQYPRAWNTATIRDPDWRLSLTPNCITELKRALRVIKAKPAAAESFRLADFELPDCRALIEQARTMLEDGTGLVCFDRLPVEGLRQRRGRQGAILDFRFTARTTAAAVFRAAHDLRPSLHGRS